MIARGTPLFQIIIALAALAIGCPSRGPEDEGRGDGTDGAAPKAREVDGASGGESDGPGGGAADPEDRRDERLAMVARQIAARGIDDEQVLEAMRRVPRHRLVPEGVSDSAYADGALPIGHGQTISQPYMVALMTQKLDLDGDEKVLEIGTGSGYQAAVLAEICREVYTIEIVEALHERATRDLRDLGYDGIRTRLGDGYFGWEEHAPFDGIVITAATSEIPPPLLDQLAEGGRLVIPLGNPLQWQTLTIVEKEGNDLVTTYSTTCRFVPLTGRALEER